MKHILFTLVLIFILSMTVTANAGTYTPNHNLFKPALGEEQSVWYPLINANFDTIDAFISDVVSDTTPQLGGNLDINGKNIVSVSNGDIPLTPNGTGAVKLGKTVLNSSTVPCAANVCTDVPASPFIIVTTDATAGADVLTIADGVTGEVRVITLKTDGTTDLEITPTNFANGTKITLSDAGESAQIMFDGTKWFVIVTYGGVIN